MNTQFVALRNTVAFDLEDAMPLEIKKGETLDSGSRAVELYETKIYVAHKYILDREDFSIVNDADS